MALQSSTKIYIKDTPIFAFQKLSLFQPLADHHHLEVVCRMDVLEPLGGALSEESRKFLGSKISVIITSGDNFQDYGELEFNGIVTEVKSIRSTGVNEGDSVVIKAMSPTILADDGPHNVSHLDKSISDIISSTFNKYNKSALELVTQPTEDTTIHYSVQQNESSFKYAARLAAQYGQWLYYNGRKLVFGKPETEELKLSYKYDLRQYDITLVPKPSNYLYFANDFLLDDTHEKSTEDISAKVNGNSNFVSDKSKEMFVSQPQVFNNVFIDQDLKSRFDQGVTVQKKAIENNQVMLTGISDNPGIKLGNIVKIEGENFRITKITHATNKNGDYSNNFEGVLAENTAYPLTNINAFPPSQSQVAIVKENNDPEGIGRIKVQFAWQKQAGEVTPWLRIVTPHSGGDKGFHFIPENGEEVLIDFEGGNAERPFVMGSLYHSSHKPESWKTETNDIKAIRTRSGHLLQFTEDESIILTDKSGNEIHLDTTGSNITITAPETMTFNCKNMVINVGENMTTSVGMNKSDSIGMNSNESTGAMKSTTVGADANMMVMGSFMEFIQGDLTSETVKGREESASEIKVSSNKGNITKNAKGNVQNNSGEKGNNF